MMRRMRFIIQFGMVAVLIICGKPGLFAQSIYGANGIGELKYFGTIRAVGLGGASIALIDNIAQNQINPALWSGIEKVSYNLSIRTEGLKYNHPVYAKTSGQTAFNDVCFTIKANPRFAFGGGIHTVSNADYKLSTNTADYHRIVESNGGISTLYCGSTYQFKGRIAIGIMYNYLFGADNGVWRIDYTTSYSDAETEMTRQKKGNGLTAGMLCKINPRFRVGGVFSSASNLESQSKIKTIAILQDIYYYGVSNQEKVKDKPIHIPFSYGIGFATDLHERIQVAGDVYSWQYKKLDSGGNAAQMYRNSTRYSGGVEFKGTKSVGRVSPKNWSVRVGGYVWNLYTVDIDGSTVWEKFLTSGISIPFNDYNTRIDIGFEGGIRSSASKKIGSETIFRVYIGLVGSEKWFERKSQNQ